MTRPSPTISSPNKYDAYFRQARRFADRFAGFEGVVGVLLTGGVARGYADHFSELDLAIYLARPHFEDWARRGLAPFPEGTPAWTAAGTWTSTTSATRMRWRPSGSMGSVGTAPMLSSCTIRSV
ncbi:MAG: hypothetical protein WBW48_12315 [Anaerolineae bacterium]